MSNYKNATYYLLMFVVVVISALTVMVSTGVSDSKNSPVLPSHVLQSPGESLKPNTLNANSSKKRGVQRTFYDRVFATSPFSASKAMIVINGQVDPTLVLAIATYCGRYGSCFQRLAIASI